MSTVNLVLLCTIFDTFHAAVRTGSLSQFQTTLNKHAAQFESDKTYTLIVRLRQNVIKTGIRRLSLSYSRISLRDICVKLHLDSEEDAEYIVGKAIRDGVIEGRIVHEKGWMECGSQKGGYGPEVSDVFARRIGYCLELHNESVKVGFEIFCASAYCAHLRIYRLCGIHLMLIEKNWLRRKARVNARGNSPKKSKKANWMTMKAWEETSEPSLTLCRHLEQRILPAARDRLDMCFAVN